MRNSGVSETAKRQCAASLVAILLTLGWAERATSATASRLVQDLPKLEVSLGMAVNGGYLFSTVSRTRDNEPHHVAILNTADFSTLATIDLPHTAQEIHALTPTSVLVLGKSADPWTGKYSQISWASGHFVVSTHIFADYLIPESFGGSPQNMIFAEPGSRGIYRLGSSRRLIQLQGEVSGPGAIALAGNTIWVLSRGSLFDLGDERISTALTTSPSIAYANISSDYTRGMVDLKTSGDGRFVIAANATSQKLLVFDGRTQQLVSELSLDHFPETTAVFGSCAATLDPDGMSVEVAKISAEGILKHLATIDISGAGDRLKRPRALLIDGAHHRLIARSAYPCPSCTTSQSSVFAFEDRDSTWWGECEAP